LAPALPGEGLEDGEDRPSDVVEVDHPVVQEPHIVNIFSGGGHPIFKDAAARALEWTVRIGIGV